MKRYLALLALLLAATGCTQKNPNRTNVPEVQAVRSFDENGTLRSDNRGQAVAGAGRVITSDTSPVKDLAKAVPANSDLAYGRFSYSRLDSIRVDRVKETEEKYKGANQALKSLVDAGAAAFKGDYAAAIKGAADTVSTAWQDYQQAQVELANSPQAGQGAVDTEIFISGPDSASALTAIASDTSRTLQAGLGRDAVSTSRTTSKTEDISTEAENLRFYGVIENIGTNYVQLLLAQLKQAEKDSEDPTKVEPAPKPEPTPDQPVPDNASPEVRANAWYPNVPRGGGNNAAVANGVGKALLWKPVSDSNGKTALHTANHHYVTGVEILGPDGTLIEKPGLASIANGYRPLFRLSKPGSGYPAGTKVKHLPSGYTVTIAEPGKRTTLNDTPAYAPAGPGTVEPADPLPPPTGIINDGPTNAVPKAVSQGGVLRVPPVMLPKILRAQVIHTRNGFAPAFDVSGVKGVGVDKGFQWINYGKSKDGVWNAGKPLSQFPSGTRGPAVWLISMGKENAGAFGSNRDGDLVVGEA